MTNPSFIYAGYDPATTVICPDCLAGQTPADILQADQGSYISPVSNQLSVDIDLRAATLIEALAIAGENLNGCTLELRGSTDNFVGSDVAVSAAAALSGNLAAWRSFTAATYRYWRVIITGMPTGAMVYHVVLTPLIELPYLETADPGKFSTDTSHMISPQGHFLGSQKVKTEIKESLQFGQVVDAEYAAFQAWAETCIRSPRCFFYVPDTSAAACYFGYVEPAYSFSAPYKNGLRSMAPIPFIARTS